MRTEHTSFSNEPIITLMPDVTYTQVPFWFNGTMQPLKMDILLPKHKGEIKPQPTLVWLCGGAFQQVDRHIWIPELVWFAKHGFTVASVEYRISMNAVYPAQLEDVQTAIRYLRSHCAELCIDPDRIAVMGESAGGYLANMVGVMGEGDTAVQAVVDLYGIGEMHSLPHDDVNNGDSMTMLMGCPEQGHEALYRDASPIHHVSATTPPFLIFHGTADPLIPVTQSEQLYQALTDAGVDADLHVYHGIPHGADEFYQPPVKQLIADFLLAHMNG